MNPIIQNLLSVGIGLYLFTGLVYALMETRYQANLPPSTYEEEDEGDHATRDWDVLSFILCIVFWPLHKPSDPQSSSDESDLETGVADDES
jgi:hypothetical protein